MMARKVVQAPGSLSLLKRRVDHRDTVTVEKMDTSWMVLVSTHGAVIIRHSFCAWALVTISIFKKSLRHCVLFLKTRRFLIHTKQVIPQAVHPIAGENTKD